MKRETFEHGQFYHVYNRGNNKQDIFFEEKNYIYFLNLVKKYLLEVADVYCYCLLKNHFHIIIKIKEEEEIDIKYRDKVSQPISNMFNSYAKSINKAYDRSGSLFQEHLKRIKISDEKYLVNLILYIHLNPVKHGLTKSFADYPYSSFRSYISDRESSLKKNYILELFASRENFIFQHKESKIIYEGIINEIDNLDD